jgi:hypothetical protein
MKRFSWLMVALLLVGCGRETVSTAVPDTNLPPSEAVAEAEVVPTDDVAPVLPTTTSLPTVVPSPPSPPTPWPTIVAPTPTNEPTLPDVPALVWLPYATGNFGQPVLMLDNETVTPQTLPVEVEIFFDYNAGWLAYGSYFWEPTADQQSVTDLHLYNFATGEDAVWAEQVGRAALTPLEMVAGPPSVAVAIHNGKGFDLILVRGPENRTVLVEDIDPYFSWSPDGSQIAYLRDNELFVTSVAAESGSPPIASGVYVGSGWIGDAPLWLGDSGYLLYADAPFAIVVADGSESIVPTAVDGTPLPGGRTFAMLYAASTHQLIAESEWMFGTSVAVYQLGEGFTTAVLTKQIDDAQLVGWNELDESVIIVSGGEPMVLPLTPQD